jgi:hypothetical protein
VTLKLCREATVGRAQDQSVCGPVPTGARTIRVDTSQLCSAASIPTARARSVTSTTAVRDIDRFGLCGRRIGDGSREKTTERRPVRLTEHWSRYTRALATILGRSAIPYGYTITVWTSGAAAERRLGAPSLLETYLFMAGAVAAFAVVAFVAGIERDPPRAPHADDLIRMGLRQALALGLALGAAALAAKVDGLTAWPLVSFVATVVYLATAGIELLLSHRHGERE